MSDPYLGHITIFSGTYIPQGYAECNGQLLPIAGNEALYSLLGTQFGGDGSVNFALPDYRGRIPVGVGNGPGLEPISYGQRAGVETVTLTTSEMPAHDHGLEATSANAASPDPTGRLFATMDESNTAAAYHGSSADITLSDHTLSEAGDGQPHNNMMPYMVLRFIIATQGVYPPRS